MELSNFCAGGKPLRPSNDAAGLCFCRKAGTRAPVRRSLLLASLVLSLPGVAVSRVGSAQTSQPVPDEDSTDVQSQADAPPWVKESEAENLVDVDAKPPGSARMNLFIAGAATTVGFYGLAFGTSYLWPSSPVADDLRIPIVGPYSAVFGAGCGDHERDCDTFDTVLRTALASVSALGQTGGVLLLAEAIFLDTDSSAASAASGTGSAEAAASVEPVFYAAPIADDTTFGFAIGGSF